MNSLKCIFVFLTFIICTSGRRIRRADELDLTPQIEGRIAIECTAKNGQKGQCVHETYCNEDHTIMPGGVIEDFELREKTCKEFDWCCTNVTTPPIIATTNNVCTSPDSDNCPWCVSLHKSLSTTITKTGLFCMGSMIATKVILTASTCIKAAQKQMLWAQVPLSADPKRNYTVRYRQLHQHYNSGSHAYDFGILVLENDVDWGKEKWKGACLGLRTPLKGDCVGFGFDADGAIVSTLLRMSQGGCDGVGNTPDAACGTKFDDYCLIAPGSPVLCSVNKGLIVAGVARFSCMRDSALLGELSFSASWLSDELNKMKVLPKYYQINANSIYVWSFIYILAVANQKFHPSVTYIR